MLKFKLVLIAFFFLSLAPQLVLATTWINLNEINGEIKISDSSSLDGMTSASWNTWVKQNSYVNKAGLIGKYAPRTGQRSYLIRTAITNSLSIALSQDGTTTGLYTSLSNRQCKVAKNNEWTMLTITYSSYKSLISYYRNGALCDQDATVISRI